MPKFYFEDFSPGWTAEYGPRRVTREEMIGFAAQYDPQPMHLDEEAARKTMLGGLGASGWHTCAMAMRLMVTNFLQTAASLGSPGLENVKWMKQVFPGDTLRLQHRILESRPMSSRPDVGLVRTQWEMFNHHGEQVLHMEGWGMFRRRTPAT